MNSYQNRKSKSNDRSVINPVSRKISGGNVNEQLLDFRLQSTAQAKLQEMANRRFSNGAGILQSAKPEARHYASSAERDIIQRKIELKNQKMILDDRYYHSFYISSEIEKHHNGDLDESQNIRFNQMAYPRASGEINIL